MLDRKPKLETLEDRTAPAVLKALAIQTAPAAVQAATRVIPPQVAIIQQTTFKTPTPVKSAPAPIQAAAVKVPTSKADASTQRATPPAAPPAPPAPTTDDTDSVQVPPRPTETAPKEEDDGDSFVDTASGQGGGTQEGGQQDTNGGDENNGDSSDGDSSDGDSSDDESEDDVVVETPPAPVPNASGPAGPPSRGHILDGDALRVGAVRDLVFMTPLRVMR